MVAAQELDESRAALGVLVERALQRRNDLRRLVDVLAVEAHGLGHVGHARLGVVRDLPRVGIVTGAPEAWAIAGVPAVVDVQRRDADAVARHRLEVAHHVADAGVTGDVHALAVRIRELGADSAGKAEAERGDVAPAEEAAWNLRLVDRARLVARVAGISG